MVKIAIIVLNYKQALLTQDTIKSLLQINHPKFDYQIFLVNNNPPDESLDIFEGKYGNNQKITLISTGSNLGYAGGNNFGIKAALRQNFDYYLIINNDVIVDKNFLFHLYNTARLQKTPAIVGPKIYFAPGFEFHKDRYKKKDLGKVIWSMGGKMDWNNIYGSNISVDKVDHGQFDKINENIDFVSGCCLMASRGVFKTIGLLDKNYFMYLEDVDFCQRAKKSKLKLACIPKSIIWHVNSGSSKSGGDLHDYFITRNRIYFAYKYASLRTKIAIFRESIKMLFNQSKWKKQAVIDVYKHKMKKGSWQ
jgi:hypothetical protein